MPVSVRRVLRPSFKAKPGESKKAWVKEMEDAAYSGKPLKTELNRFEVKDFAARITDDHRLSSRLYEIHLKKSSIGAKGAEHLMDALRSNKTVRFFYADGNSFGNAAGHIKLMLMSNDSLELLGLRRNSIKESGVKQIADGLIESRALRTLHLGINMFKDKGAMHLAGALKIQSVNLRKLTLEGTGIGDIGVKALAESLRRNQYLEILDLSQNDIKEDGAEELANMLRVNRTLRELFLAKNNIKNYGAKEFDHALDRNSSLVRLDVRDNNITAVTQQRLRNNHREVDIVINVD